MKLEEKIEISINTRIKELGFEIEYIEFVREVEQNILRIVLDKENSTVSIDDCEAVSRSIEDIIDTLIDKEYILEVASPGLERELKNISLYTKYIGSEVLVKLYKKIENEKEIKGVLLDVEDNSIIIKIDERNVKLDIGNISSAHTVYDFKEKLGSSKKQNLNQLKKF